VPDLQQLSEQAVAFVGTRFEDVEITSAMLNQVLRADRQLHDVIYVGWRSDRIPGVHYVITEAIEGWETNSERHILYERCAIGEIYAGSLDARACASTGGPFIAV
jgi:hypothetical protein